MILGAHLGIDAIPQKWLSELKSYQNIVELMDQIDRNWIEHFDSITVCKFFKNYFILWT